MTRSRLPIERRHRLGSRCRATLAALVVLSLGLAAWGPACAGEPRQGPSPASPAQKSEASGDTPAASRAAPSNDAAKDSAIAACLRQLATLDIVFERLAPITTPECPVPAPLKVSRIAGVDIRPAATLTCDMAAAAGRWLTANVQPAARQLLGAPVRAIAQVSSHRCHGNYARPGRLGEHALANALDVAAFELANGRIVAVRQHWGPVARKGAVAAGPPASAGATAGAPARSAARLGAAAPHLQAPAAATEPSEAPARTFLLRVHREACGPFTTVLGPEANDAHLDHLHLDLATRKGRPFCE